MSKKVNLENVKFNIFKNINKKADNQPDWNGSFEVDGEFFKISIWGGKTDKNGNPYLSASLGEDTYRKQQNKKPSTSSNDVEETEDDVFSSSL